MLATSMLDWLKTVWLGSRDGAAHGGERSERERLSLAAAALFVEAARIDGHVDDRERESVLSALQRGFGLSEAEARSFVEAGLATEDRAVQLYGLTKVIKDRLAPEERIGIMELLWEVAYADGRVSDLEASLARRIAGLLYVPDQDSGAARKRVLERIGKTHNGLT